MGFVIPYIMGNVGCILSTVAAIMYVVLGVGRKDRLL